MAYFNHYPLDENVGILR